MLRSRLLLAVVAVAAAANAGAEDGPSGILNAVSFKPIPAGRPILVRPLDDTVDNLAIKADIEAALTERGFVLGTDPRGIVLSFASSTQPGYWTNAPRRTYIELQGSTGSGTRVSKESRGMVNLYDSQQGAVFNEGKRDAATPAATMLRLDVNIDDKTEGKSLWVSWALADLAESDPPTLAKAMVPAIVDAIGTGVKERPFKLREESEGGGTAPK